MNKLSIFAPLLTLALASCATQTPPVTQTESPHSLEAQRQAQAQTLAEHNTSRMSLKRKVALGRISNETNYGKSLLLNNPEDRLGKQVTDILSKSLTESGNFLVFERPDIELLQNETQLTGQTLNLVGVDALIIGSLTEFGRSVTGRTGFLSDTRQQRAFAKVDLRLVDVKTGLAFYSVSGAGEASTESGSIAGFGSRAAYDGTLNDAAIRNAVSDAINKLSSELLRKPWQTDILAAEDTTLYISGGKNQGLREGMELAVKTRGRQVASGQTGFMITLPGETLGTVRITSTFGDTEHEEGAVAQLVSGSIAGHDPQQLIITEKE